MTEDYKQMKMAAVLTMLVDKGVAEVEIYYNGGGDDGSIENINYNTRSGTYRDHKMDPLIEEYLKDFCYDNLLEQIGDWVNGDGGYGAVTINCNTGEYEIRSTMRIISEEVNNFEGKLSEHLE